MQHSGYRYYGCLLLCLLCLLSAGKNAAAVDFLPPEIEKFIKINKVNKKNIGLLLQREDGTIVASHQAERKFNPASVAKIITTLAALDILGTKFTWQTKIATNGRVKKGVVEGDLYLIGGGDPYLTVDNFLYLLNSLRSQGIHEIRGDIIIDDSIFMLPPHNPAKFDGASTKPYNVGAGGLIVNFKTQQIVFAPRDNKVHVYSDPPNAYFTIDNRVKLSKRGCRNWRGKIREQLFGNAQRITLRLSGAYAARCKTQSFYLSVLDHPAYVAGVFGALWERLGGTWSGNWKQGSAPKKATVLLKHDSQSLPLVLAAMNKFSNNVIARNLFISLAAGDKAPPPYTPQAAQQRLQRWLNEKGVPDIKIENGSGLSRIARISPAQMTHLLTTIWRHSYRPEILASLPILGKDGTLRKRLKNKKAAGSGHLKTGSLDGVSAISGFIRDNEGRYLFMTLFSEKQYGGRVRRLQDNIIDWVRQSKK